jgi:hypothetical protein
VDILLMSSHPSYYWKTLISHFWLITDRCNHITTYRHPYRSHICFLLYRHRSYRYANTSEPNTAKSHLFSSLLQLYSILLITVTDWPSYFHKRHQKLPIRLATHSSVRRHSFLRSYSLPLSSFIQITENQHILSHTAYSSHSLMIIGKNDCIHSIISFLLPFFIPIHSDSVYLSF